MKRTVAMTRTTPETRNHDNIPIFILVFISITPKVKPLRHASCIYTHSDGRFCFLNGLKRENLFSIYVVFPPCHNCAGLQALLKSAVLLFLCFVLSDSSVKMFKKDKKRSVTELWSDSLNEALC